MAGGHAVVRNPRQVKIKISSWCYSFPLCEVSRPTALYGRGLGPKEKKKIKIDFPIKVSNQRIKLKFRD